jgi:hypothetical protein
MARRFRRARPAWTGVGVLVCVGCVACAAPSVTPVPATPVPLAATLTPSGTPSPPAPQVNPCLLTTRAQVQAGLGGVVTASQLDLTNPDIPTCLWAVADSTVGSGTLRVAVTGLSGTVTTFRSMQKSFAGAKNVSGVDSAAFTVDDLGQLILFRNGTTITLAASGFVLNGADPPREQLRAVLTSVGKSVAANL